MTSLETKSVSGAPYLAPKLGVLHQVVQETTDTVTLIIEPPQGYEAWQPGQFNMLYHFGVGEIPISISGAQHDTGWLTHTIRVVGPVSKALCQQKAGSAVWLRGPYGRAWPEVSSKQDVLFVAGGIGLAPLRPAILAAIAKQHRGRVVVLYGARTKQDLLFMAELQRWRQQPNVTVLLSVDQLAANHRQSWSGSVGVVTQLLPQAALAAERTTVLTCGPDVMMRHVVKELGTLGVCDANIFVSLERNMKCAVGFCGRCQWGPHFVCRDGPVYSVAEVRKFWMLREF